MDFFMDFLIFAVLVVVITAFMGSIGSLIGEGIFGKKKNSIYDQDSRKRAGWKRLEREAE